MGVSNDTKTSVSTEFEKIPSLTKIASEAAVRSFEEHLDDLVESVRGLEVKTGSPRDIFQMNNLMKTKSTKQSTAEEFQDVCKDFFEETDVVQKPVISIHTNSSPEKVFLEDARSSENKSEKSSLRWRDGKNHTCPFGVSGKYNIYENDAKNVAIERLLMSFDRRPEREDNSKHARLSMTDGLSDNEDDPSEHSFDFNTSHSSFMEQSSSSSARHNIIPDTNSRQLQNNIISRSELEVSDEHRNSTAAIRIFPLQTSSMYSRDLQSSSNIQNSMNSQNSKNVKTTFIGPQIHKIPTISPTTPDRTSSNLVNPSLKKLLETDVSPHSQNFQKSSSQKFSVTLPHDFHNDKPWPPQVYHLLKLTTQCFNPTINRKNAILILNDSRPEKSSGSRFYESGDIYTTKPDDYRNLVPIDEINLNRPDFDDFSRAALTLGDLFQLKNSLPSDVERFVKYNNSKNLYRRLLDKKLPKNIPLVLLSEILKKFKTESGKLFLFCSELLYQVQLAQFEWKFDTRIEILDLNLSKTHIQNWKQLNALKTHPGSLKNIDFSNMSFSFSDNEHLEDAYKVKRFATSFSSGIDAAGMEKFFKEEDREIVSEDFSLIFMKIMNIFVDENVISLNLSGIFKPMWLVWQDSWATAHSKYFNHEKRLLNWLIKSKFSESSLKCVDLSNTTLLDSHFVDLVRKCENLEEINISNTLVTDIECLRPIAKNIRVLKADTLRFDLNQRIKKLEDGSLCIHCDHIDQEGECCTDECFRVLDFGDRPTSKRDPLLVTEASTIASNTLTIIKRMKNLKTLHLGNHITEKLFNHYEAVLQSHIMPVESEHRPATMEFKHLLLEYGYEHSGVLNETQVWSSTGNKDGDKRKLTAQVDRVLCNYQIYSEIWARFLDSEHVWPFLEEIKFAECSSSFDGYTKCRKDRITNFVDRLPSLVQVSLPPRVFEMFKKYDAIEKLENAFVKINCSCENLDGVENLKYALNVLNPVNPCRKKYVNEKNLITSDNRQITQALNFIFNFTNRQIGITPDSQKTMEMITLLMEVTEQKNYELNCLKEFVTKFHGFYKKTQLSSLEKDCDPMQAFSSGMTGPRRARPVMPFYQNFNSILQTCRKKEAIFTGLEEYFQLLQAVTAVFYNCLSDRIEISKSVSKNLVPKILHSVLDILELTSISTEFMRAAKNCLLILCQESALSSEFDFFRASSLILKTLDRFGWDKDVNKHDQLNIRRLTVAITSILASKVGTDQTPLLGQRQYLSRIIMCAKERFLVSTRANVVSVELASSPMEFQHATSIDAIYKYSLSALWNLTDESPNSSSIFIEEGGLDVCLESLDLYDDDEIKDYYTNKAELDKSLTNMLPQSAEALELLKTEAQAKQRVQLYVKVLGLLSNVAEVQHLHQKFSLSLLELIRQKLFLENDKIEHTMDAAYFAAGTLCHMLTNETCGLGVSVLHSFPFPDQSFEQLDFDWKRCLAKDICLQICKFENPSKEMVVYRSFRPFIVLLSTVNWVEHLKTPATLMWALWAIHHVTTRSLENEKLPKESFLPAHGQKYLDMIRSEGIIELVHEIRRVYSRPDLCSYDVTGFVMECGDSDLENCDNFKLREVFTEYESNEVRDKILELTELIIGLAEEKES